MKCHMCLRNDLRGLQVICWDCAAPRREECRRIIEAKRGRACNASGHSQSGTCTACVAQGYTRTCGDPCSTCHQCGEPAHKEAAAA